MAIEYIRPLFFDKVFCEKEHTMQTQYKFTYPLDIYESSYMNSTTIVLTSCFSKGVFDFRKIDSESS